MSSTTPKWLTSGPLTSGTSGNWLAAATTKIGTIPAGAIILRILQATSVVNNAGTNKFCAVGTTASGAELVASGANEMATLGQLALTLTAAAAVPVAAETDVWVTNNCTGTTATTGTGVFLVEYIVV